MGFAIREKSKGHERKLSVNNILITKKIEFYVNEFYFTRRALLKCFFLPFIMLEKIDKISEFFLYPGWCFGFLIRGYILVYEGLYGVSLVFSSIKWVKFYLFWI